MLEGAKLDGGDFHGALGLTATQVCSTASSVDAQFDPDVQAAVQALCKR